MTLRYSSGRSSSDLSKSSFSEESDINASTILNRISINSDIAAGPLTDNVFDVEDSNNDELNHDGRVIFKRNNTNMDDLTADTENNPDSDSDENYYEDIDIGGVFEEIRQTYGEDLSETLSAYSRSASKEIDIHDIEESIDHLPEGTHPEENDKSCANCCKPRRVENVSWLKEGQHIRLPGARLTFSFRRKLVPVYYHHAIVKRVNKTFENSIELVLVNFSKVKKKITINEETVTYDLENDEIDIMDYEHPRYDPKTVVQRAESMVPKETETEGNKTFGSYNVFCCNCEHFASWCVVGEGESFQAKGVLKSSAEILCKAAGTGCKIGRFIKRFLNKATTKITAGFNFGKYIPGMFLGATAIIYLIYTVAMTIAYRVKLSKGKLCKVCFKREVIALWTNFGAFCITSGISYLVVHFLLPLLTPTPVGIPLFLVLVLLSLFLQWGIGKLVKALRSPYACDKIEVKHLSQITPGSMISFKYFRIPHFAIVTEKHVESAESKIGTITCVHYGLKGLNVFGTREVIEESFELDVNDNIKNVKLVDCRQLKTFPPDDIVKRVRARIGEKTWKPFSNRSDHLCFDTIVIEGNDGDSHSARSKMIGKSSSKHKSSFYVGKKEIHLRSDLHIGHIVKYKGHVGIVVRLEDVTEGGEQNFKMDMIVHWDSWVIRKRFSVDLKNERLLIMKYNPAHCCPMDDRVQRARQIEGELSEFRTGKDFLENCILKKL
ncbi:uncharacterized protein LOC123542189 [Mercenaria mercenaria]|uniref:uncharacterized protein LOC123542189 n=1 Tax=Mercenaria mercenaria TaxID=6596 RepID=UPI00234E6295|nr:uncharacterized protein LOC123542189 [Mercenaria mercenaria]XP_053387573.1 uncharacterized protein LOC123542189 [Mercenaria mercenaria]XP_053387574.1 uncharacterized protein LOC123542189 [Mercenaria mercenaria]XP_053387575.1 uncharacterized protein LOC123542189 [Mercenaria mercenaria]